MEKERLGSGAQHNAPLKIDERAIFKSHPSKLCNSKCEQLLNKMMMGSFPTALNVYQYSVINVKLVKINSLQIV